ncbi:MAG: hypothetical protein QW514_09405 [Thermoprotei archaeon]
MLEELFELYLKRLPKHHQRACNTGRNQRLNTFSYISSVSYDIAKLRRSQTPFKPHGRGNTRKEDLFSLELPHNCQRVWRRNTKDSHKLRGTTQKLYILNILKTIDPNNDLH